MKLSNRAKKGRRFENYIASEIEAEGFGKTRRESGSGSGQRKGDIAANLPFLLEAKNWDKIKILEWIRQAKEQAQKGNYDSDKWGLVFKDPNSPEERPEVYVTLDFYQFLKLLKKNEEPRIKEPDRELRWKLQRLIDAAKSALKEIEK